MAPGKLLAQQLSRTSQFRVCITLAFLQKKNDKHNQTIGPDKVEYRRACVH